MKINQVISVQLLQGVNLGNGNIRQSFSLNRVELVGSHFRVQDIQAHDYGLQVKSTDRWFVVPWHLVASCEFITDEEPAFQAALTEAKAQLEAELPSVLRVDPVAQKRRDSSR